MFKKSLISLLSVFIFYSCQVDPKIIPAQPVQELSFKVPAGWPNPRYNFSNNEITQDKFALGRALFYENMLSKDNSISCGSCHQNFVAFAHADHDLSHGINDKLGNRNSPAIFNLAWHSSFMHDGGINHIEVQPLAPISNPVEMGEEINNVMSKLRASAKYKDLFTKAYGDEKVSTERMFKSMAQFMGMMISSESKYDHFKRNEIAFNEQELKGYDLFVQKCSSCHTEPLFSDFDYRNNGLLPDAKYSDSGRAVITKQPQDIYKFKTPSLRNVALTHPYMHDGRYKTLEECLDHYTSAVKNHENLDPKLAYGIPMTPDDKRNIIVFLHTLTDRSFINDKRFADPNIR